VFALLLGVLACMTVAHAAEERYDYDALGRLIRVIDEQGRVTQYVYDPAGNILQVITGAGGAQTPTVVSVSPNALRRGEAKLFTIVGSGFTGAHVASPNGELDITNLRATATQVSFTLAAGLAAPLGAQTFTISNAAGSAPATIIVNPALPKASVDPTPLAIPPDNVARQIAIRLSSADTVPHVVALSVSNTNMSISPATVTIPAGQIQATATVTGITAGQSTITLTSATLGNTLVPVFITSEFRGISTSYSLPLGILLQGSATAPPPTSRSLFSNTVGVAVGRFVLSAAPRNLPVGAGPTTLTITGAGLDTAQVVTVTPATGITLGALSAAPDGRSLTLPITVASDAAPSLRKIVVSGAAGVFLPATPDADRINILRPAPEVQSVDPIFALRGDVLAFTVRGRNLHEAQSVSMTPSTGVAVGAPVVVSADGTTLTTSVSVTSNAPLGDRVVTVTTLGGVSSAAPSPTNTFRVVEQAVQNVTPIVAPVLGIVLQSGAAPPPSTFSLFTPAVGVSRGPSVVSMTPSVGVIGESPTITLTGNELQGVTAIQFTPNTGITLGAITVAPDGKSVSLPLTIDAAAPQILRTVKVLAGATAVPFASPEAALFRVSLPVPVVDSVAPIVMQVGQAPVALTVRGRNFQNATAVSIVPSSGLSIANPPSVAADGTSVTVNISAVANAAIGPRLVVVTTPAGDSATMAGVQNTLTLTATAGTTYSPITSSLLGILKLDGSPPPTLSIGPVVSPLVGVDIQQVVVTPPATTRSLFTSNLGVALGATATGLSPSGYLPGSVGTLTIAGFGLQGTTAVTVNPATGITFGALTVTPDGQQVNVPVTVAADAAPGLREVRLQNASGAIRFANPTANRLGIAQGVPVFDSIVPIVSAQGTSFTLTIRGSNFLGATAVTVTPSEGITFTTGLTVNAAGTQADIGIAIAPNTPLGSRIIQLVVPGAVSSGDPSPFNTFTVIAP
jgi:YD repeat-containing protein